MGLCVYVEVTFHCWRKPPRWLHGTLQRILLTAIEQDLPSHSLLLLSFRKIPLICTELLLFDFPSKQPPNALQPCMQVTIAAWPKWYWGNHWQRKAQTIASSEETYHLSHMLAISQFKWQHTESSSTWNKAQLLFVHATTKSGYIRAVPCLCYTIRIWPFFSTKASSATCHCRSLQQIQQDYIPCSTITTHHPFSYAPKMHICCVLCCESGDSWG